MLNRIASRLSQRLSMLTLAAVRTVSEPPREKAGELSSLASSFIYVSQPPRTRLKLLFARPVRGGLLALALMIILSLTSTAIAASERGRVVGSVTDPAGAKIAGARVTLRDATGAVVSQGSTDNEGQFSI
ncbi:MAG TPA: carboxypeptidase-like regulatory domain-containing protein, partial [Blastocatellia bacterium]|nr:carboxypeptidase-like regulatory domain-containing protein [Blastocatellia bacterium]